MVFRLEMTQVPVTGGVKKTYKITKATLLSRLSRIPNLEQTPYNYVRWLVELKPTITAATFRLYKAALLEHFADINAAEEGRLLEDIKSEGCKKRGRRSDWSANTSGLKSKFVRQDTKEKVDNYLKKGEGIYDFVVRGFVDATILTGLRPAEWRTAFLDTKNNEIILKVKNAKYIQDPESHEQRRSHGIWRTLRLTDLTENELAIIEFQIESVQTHGKDDEQWENFYSSIRSRLKYVNRRIIKTKQQRFSLYSCRHQFGANAKAAGIEPVEIACLMGHLTDLTCIKHYGRKTYGWKTDRSFPIKAKPSELKRIRRSDKLARTQPRDYPGDRPAPK